MALGKGMQLLRMPAFMEDGTMNNVPYNDQESGHSQQSFKLLSMPVQQAMEMSPQLIRIPKRLPNYPNMPLLKLPNNAASQYAGREKRHLLVDIRNIQSNDTPKPFCLPLLSRSGALSEPSLIQIPLVKDDDNSNLRLVKIPIKETPRMRQPVKMNHRDFAESENEYQVPMVPRANERASIQERPDDSSYTNSSKRKRQRRRRDHPKSNNEKSAATLGKTPSQQRKGNLQQRASKETQTAVETQEVRDQKKKIKQRRKKLNLMALLEQAALLDETDISTDDDTDLRALRNRSYLIDEEPYRKEDEFIAKSRRSARYDTEKERQLKSGLKKPTIEELLLQNFDEVTMPHDRGPEESNGAKSNRKGIDIFEKSSKPNKIRPKTESSTQTFHDVQFPKFDLSDKPKSSVGLSWKEMMHLKNESSETNIKKKVTIGTQVYDLEPAVEKIEQVCQTDFVHEKDVEELLLDNFRDKKKMDEAVQIITEEDSSRHKKKRNGYPWEHISDTNFDDVQVPRAFEIPKRREKEIGSDVTKNRNDALESRVEKRSVVWNEQGNERKDYREQSSRLHIPPEILLGMKIQGDHIEAMDSATERRSQPLNVVDISRPSSPTEDGVVLTESIIVDDVPVERLVESVELAEEQVQIAHIVDDADAQDKYIERFANEEVISTDRKQILGHDQEKPLQNVRASTATSRRSEVAKESEKFQRILESAPKDRMHHNLRNMSVQLNALDDLYEHLEKELQSSAMLMQTVQTLHHDFLEEPDPFERRAERRPSYNKYSKTSDGAKFIPERRNRDQLKRYPESDLQIKDANEVVKEAESVSLADRITTSVKDRNMDDVGASRQSSEELRANEVGSIDRQGRGSEENLHEDLGHEDMSDVGLSSEVESVLDDDDLNRVSFVSNEDASGGINDNEEEPIDEVDVIRQRLAQRYPTKSPRRVEEDKISKERDIKEKLEKKRQALRDWMKKKRTEQNQKYLNELEERRQKESRPFSSKKNSASQREIKKAGRENKKKKMVVEEENFQERIDGAQQLYNDLLAVRSNATAIEKSSRPVLTERQPNKRKRMNTQQISKNQSKVKHNIFSAYGRRDATPGSTRNGTKRRPSKTSHDIERNDNPGKILLENISPTWKNAAISTDEEFLREILGDTGADEHLFQEDIESDMNTQPLHSSTARLRDTKPRYQLELGSLSDRKTPRQLSARSRARRSVEGKDFVTVLSMENYMTRTKDLVRASIREFASKEFDDLDSMQSTLDSSRHGNTFLNSSGGLNATERFMLDRIMKGRQSNEGTPRKVNKRQRTLSPVTSENETRDVQGILSQYGLLDDEIGQYDVEETNQILAEADALLETTSNEYDEAKMDNESIDWNEIDRILK